MSPPKKDMYGTESLSARSRTWSECRRADQKMAREEHLWKHLGGRDPLPARLPRPELPVGAEEGPDPFQGTQGWRAIEMPN